MSITVQPVTPDFAAEIGDVDLSKPLSGEDFDAIRNAFWKYAVLIFPDQHLTQAQHLAFSEKFGPIEKERVTVSDVANSCEQEGIAAAA